MEIYVIKHSKLFSQINKSRLLLYEDLMKTEISVVGYSDLSHEDEFYRPSEILVGTASNSFGYLSRLVLERSSGLYQPKLYAAAPADIHDILPVYIDHEFSHSPNGRGLLVAAASGVNAGVWLINLTSPSWKQVIGRQVLKAYVGSGPIPGMRFRADQNAYAVELLLVEDPRVDKSKIRRHDLSDIEIGPDKLLFNRNIVAEIDLTANLLNLGIKLEETLTYASCFIIQND